MIFDLNCNYCIKTVQPDDSHLRFRLEDPQIKILFINHIKNTILLRYDGNLQAIIHPSIHHTRYSGGVSLGVRQNGTERLRIWLCMGLKARFAWLQMARPNRTPNMTHIQLRAFFITCRVIARYFSIFWAAGMNSPLYSGHRAKCTEMMENVSPTNRKQN